MSVNVLIVDDQALVRTGLRMILDEAPDMNVVGEADDGAAAVTAARETRPDVVLMDIRMPRMDGIEATRRIQASADGTPAPRILILTTFDLDEYVFAGLQAGASGFLLKDALAADLLAAIRVVAAGDAIVGPTVTGRLVAHFVDTYAAPAGTDVADLAVLTDRERQVLEALAHGSSNAEIAQLLHIGEGTVKTHVGRIFTKLGLRDRVQAVVLAYQTGLVTAHTSSEQPLPDARWDLSQPQRTP